FEFHSSKNSCAFASSSLMSLTVVLGSFIQQGSPHTVPIPIAHEAVTPVLGVTTTWTYPTCFSCYQSVIFSMVLTTGELMPVTALLESIQTFNLVISKWSKDNHI